MTLVPEDVRINVSASFPTMVVGANGVTVAKSNGIYTILTDYTSLAQIGSVPTPSQKLVEVYDTVSKVYNTVPMSAIAGGVTDPLFVSTVIGGTAPNSTLKLQSTNNGSPSGDAVILAGSKVLYGTTTGQSMGGAGGFNPTWQTYAATAQATFAIIREVAPGGGGAIVALGSSRSTPHSGSYAAVQINDGLGQFIFVGDNGTNLNTSGAAIQGVAAANWTSSSSPANLVFQTTSSGATNSTVQMVLSSTGGLSVGSVNIGTDPGNGVVQLTAVQLVPTTVGSLPTAAAGNKGQRRFVSDANSTTFAAVVAAGGSNGVPVYSDGAAWRIG